MAESAKKDTGRSTGEIWDIFATVGDVGPLRVKLPDSAIVGDLFELIVGKFPKQLGGCGAADLIAYTPDADGTPLNDTEAELAEVLQKGKKDRYRVHVEQMPPEEEKKAAEEPPHKKVKHGEKLAIVRGARVPTNDLFPLHAGTSNPKSVFVTDSMADIIDIFDERVAAKQSVWFAGAPGTGKSQLGRLWASRCAQNGSRVLFGETRSNGFWLTRLDSDGWAQSRVRLDEFCRRLTDAAFDPDLVVVLDGAAQNMHKTIPALSNTLLENEKIVISSGQLIVKSVGLPHIQLPAWTLEELLSATNNQTFYEQTKLCKEEKKFENREEFITRKFNVTGGAPRLMFEYLTKDAENLLRSALDRLSLVEKKQVLFGELKPSHDRSQNALIHYFVDPDPEMGNAERYAEPIRKFSSQFVLWQLQSVLNLADIHKLHTQCKAINRVMEGWAFEELMLRKLSDQPGQIQKLTVRLEASTAIVDQQWTTTRLISLDMKRFAKGELTNIEGKAIEFGDRVMLRPNVYNNESWDAVIVERAGSTNWQLKFLEITLQKTHSLSEMVLLQAFEVFQKVLGNVLPTVHHYGVVDSECFPEFFFVCTTQLPDRKTRSGRKIVPQDFALVVNVACERN